MSNIERYQTKPNGPLNAQTIQFLDKTRVQRGWSYKTLGEYLGVSGPFAHAILNKPSNITTNTAMHKVAAGIDRLVADDFTKPSNAAAREQDGPSLEHTYHLRDGVQITLKLPVDLTEREAQRLSLFIQSLAL